MGCEQMLGHFVISVQGSLCVRPMNAFRNLRLSQAVQDMWWGNVERTEITDHKPS